MKVTTLPVSLSIDFRFSVLCSAVSYRIHKRFSHIRFITLSLNKAYVSVELGATIKSPARSPTKIYTPLRVVSPIHSEPSVYSIPPPTDLSLNQAKENIEQPPTESRNLTIDTTVDEKMEAETSLLNLMQLVEQEQAPETPLTNNDDSLSDASEPDTDGDNAPPVASTFSPRYSKFLNAEIQAAISQPRTPL